MYITAISANNIYLYCLSCYTESCLCLQSPIKTHRRDFYHNNYWNDLLSFFNWVTMEWSPLIIVLKKKSNNERTTNNTIMNKIMKNESKWISESFKETGLTGKSMWSASPVVEVHDGLKGAATPCVDVSLESGQERGNHVHTVPLALSVRTQSRMGDLSVVWWCLCALIYVTVDVIWVQITALAKHRYAQS